MYTEEQLNNMSDEELEQAYLASKAEEESPDTQIEEELDVEESNLEEGDSDEEIEDSDESEDGSEHPEEDSDHDASEESNEDEPTEEDTEANPDEDAEEATDEGEDKEEEAQPVQTYKFRANGKEYEFSENELKEQFPRVFGQAMDYTKKMQQIKPWRKTIDAIEQAKLNHDDINLAIDVLKGDKDAIAEIIKRTGIDALDLNVDESNYVAKDYGRDDTTLAIKDVLETISRDPEYSKTASILEREWDDASWRSISQDPEKIRLLHIDVKSGMYDKLQPIAEKLKVYDGAKKSDLEYYKDAAQSYFDSVRQQEEAQRLQELAKQEAAAKQEAEKKIAKVKKQERARDVTKKESAKRKAAAPTKTGTSKPSAIDYLDDSDEAFEEWARMVEERGI